MFCVRGPVEQTRTTKLSKWTDKERDATLDVLVAESPDAEDHKETEKEGGKYRGSEWTLEPWSSMNKGKRVLRVKMMVRSRNDGLSFVVLYSSLSWYFGFTMLARSSATQQCIAAWNGAQVRIVWFQISKVLGIPASH
jgi:hypothetical protein